MARFRLTAQAQTDFDETGAYTRDRWGLRQAETYLAEIDAMFHRIAADPHLGRPRTDLHAGMQSWSTGRHIAFFRRSRSGDVEILRILHQSQDFARHL